MKLTSPQTRSAAPESANGSAGRRPQLPLVCGYVVTYNGKRFLEECFRAGLLEHLDAVSVHPYRSYDRGPETAGANYARLRELIKKYAPAAKRSLPILSGEWDYATDTKGISPEVLALPFRA